MGNNSSSGKNQINIDDLTDMRESGISIANKIAIIVYNGLPNQYKNQIYKKKIDDIVRHKLGPHNSFVQISDLKPGNAQFNWDAIKSKNLYAFKNDVTEKLYQDNPELDDDNAYTSNIGRDSNIGLELIPNKLELKDKKGGRKTRKYNKSKRILKKYKKDKYKKSIKK